MNLLEAILLGAVQGLTEFLPISSSAHLEIGHRVLQWNAENLTFDVALHIGTVFALLVYFWRDWVKIIKSTAAKAENEISLWPILIACIPAGIAGLLLEKYAETLLRKPLPIAIAMIALGILLYIADRTGKLNRTTEEASWRDWIFVGLAQMFALIPGVSRSGITITAGLFLGLDREASARLSFLLGTPIILIAGLYEARKLAEIPGGEIPALIAGTAASTIVGFLCIKLLLNYLKKRSMGVFVAYRALFGAVVLIALALGKL